MHEPEWLYGCCPAAADDIVAAARYRPGSWRQRRIASGGPLLTRVSTADRAMENAGTRERHAQLMCGVRRLWPSGGAGLRLTMDLLDRRWGCHRQAGGGAVYFAAKVRPKQELGGYLRRGTAIFARSAPGGSIPILERRGRMTRNAQRRLRAAPVAASAPCPGRCVKDEGRWAEGGCRARGCCVRAERGARRRRGCRGVAARRRPTAGCWSRRR
jgi:hypothetical protein